MDRLSVETDEISIDLCAKNEQKQVLAPPMMFHNIQPAPVSSSTSCNEPSIRCEEPPKDLSKVITSPIIGTFYAAPSPGAKPFVSVGSTVKGDVVCIVESMKLMNELNSEVDGVVVEICVKDGDPLEFGQIIMRLE